jgi:hypothetical protein
VAVPGPIHEEFNLGLGARWQRHVVGSGALELSGSILRLTVAGASCRRYTDAQIDDYQGLPRRRFPWRPPLRLTVRARFSHPAANGPDGLLGTAGFGFWNDPFLMTGARLPALPRAIWFFQASPPSNMKLALETPGYGWKAATIDTHRPIALPLALLALPAAALMNVRSLYRTLWPPIQRAMRVREALIPVDSTAWHTYVLDWGTTSAQFSVDGAVPLLEAPSPAGPLGFVLWVDNQYMVVTPWGRLAWGLLEIEGRQWLEVEQLSIEPGSEEAPQAVSGGPGESLYH